MDRDLVSIINQLRAGTEYGVMNLAVKIHDNQINTIDSTKSTSYKTRKGNTEALQVITALIKGIQESKEDANLTFTVTFNKGTSQRILVQDVKRINMN